MHARLQADIGLSLGDMSHQLNLDEKEITALTLGDISLTVGDIDLNEERRSG